MSETPAPERPMALEHEWTGDQGRRFRSEPTGTWIWCDAADEAACSHAAGFVTATREEAVPQLRRELLRLRAERDAALRELEELRKIAANQEEADRLRQDVEDMRGEYRKQLARAEAAESRVSAMVERVRSAGCPCRGLWTAMDADECESFDGEIYAGFDSDHYCYGQVIRHDSRCPEALAQALEEIAGKDAVPDPGASPNPADWPGGVPSDPRAYFKSNPLTPEEEGYAAAVAGKPPEVQEGSLEPERQP